MNNTELIAQLRADIKGWPKVSMFAEAADTLEAAQAEIADTVNLKKLLYIAREERDEALARLAEIELHHKEVLADLDIRINYAEERLATFGKQKPVLWQYRWTNPGGDDQPASELEWKPVAATWNQSVLEKCKELEGYRYNGKPTYEVRGLFAAAGASPEPSQAIDFTSQYRADARAAIQSGGWADAVKKCLPVAECFVGSDGEVINPSPLSTLIPGDGSTIAPLYLTQPSQAVGLSAEGIVRIAAESQDGISPHDDTLRFARAIEAALRPSN